MMGFMTIGQATDQIYKRHLQRSTDTVLENLAGKLLQGEAGVKDLLPFQFFQLFNFFM